MFYASGVLVDVISLSVSSGTWLDGSSDVSGVSDVDLDGTVSVVDGIGRGGRVHEGRSCDSDESESDGLCGSGGGRTWGGRPCLASL